MGYWKVRLFALVAIAVSAWMIYSNWQQLINESRYSLQMAAFGPVVAVFGIFLLFFPQKIGRPETTLDKVVNILVFGVGLAAGLYNWYLMDPGFFSDTMALFSSAF
jgi:hypothetical protein